MGQGPVRPRNVVWMIRGARGGSRAQPQIHVHVMARPVAFLSAFRQILLQPLSEPRVHATGSAVAWHARSSTWGASASCSTSIYGPPASLLNTTSVLSDVQRHDHGRRWMAQVWYGAWRRMWSLLPQHSKVYSMCMHRWYHPMPPRMPTPTQKASFLTVRQGLPLCASANMRPGIRTLSSSTQDEMLRVM